MTFGRRTWLVFVFVAGGCGGSTQLDDGRDAAIVDASLQDGGGAVEGAADAPPSRCANGGLASGAGRSSASRVPMLHRPSDSACPLARGAAPSLRPCECGDAAGCSCPGCTSDSECDAGVNGRCRNAPGAPFYYPGCSYDECASDLDCPAGVPCECRASADDNAPNRCMAGGNCRVDGDCGSGGYCSPSLVGDFLCECPGSPVLCGDGDLPRCYAGSTQVPCSCGDSCGHAYYCHTACDQCVDDSDCDGGATCNYDIIDNRWECQTCWPIP